jgi:hypothetical protein
VLSTRVYPEEGKCFGVLPFVVGGKGDGDGVGGGKGKGVGVEKFDVWELRAKDE